MKKWILCLLLPVTLKSMAQFHMDAHLATNHLWRGMEVTDGLVFTGDINYSFFGGNSQCRVLGWHEHERNV